MCHDSWAFIAYSTQPNAATQQETTTTKNICCRWRCLNVHQAEPALLPWSTRVSLRNGNAPHEHISTFHTDSSCVEVTSSEATCVHRMRVRFVWIIIMIINASVCCVSMNSMRDPWTPTEECMQCYAIQFAAVRWRRARVLSLSLRLFGSGSSAQAVAFVHALFKWMLANN